MNIILTICSKDKDNSIGLLPAFKRYTSPRIKQVMDITKSEKKPFYILSGVYGLIKFDSFIPYYDHLLTDNEVDDLVNKVINQMNVDKIDSIDFYAEAKANNWIPYYDVIENACKITETMLNIHLIN